MEDVSVIKKAAEMNAEHLLTHFDRIADTPDAIPRLRRFILDMAVRGKLVPQDLDDEPASELLKRIAAEKARLVQAGKFKTLDGDLPRNEASFPFSVPSYWAWCYLDDLAAIARGGSPRPIKSYLTDDSNGIPWIKIGDSVRGNIYINGTKERIRPEGLAKSRLVFPGDLLLSNSMSFGFPYITNIEGCIHDGWLVIRTPDALIDKLYLHTLFLSDHAKAAFSEAASGAVVQNLNADKARELSVPLPPLAEQHRIVAKVDELMTLCDRLEAARMEREATRNRMATASLARLNTPDPDPATFQNHTAFALNNLTPLTTRPDQIKALRQTILNLAVRGKLVPQDPKDEPASELLKRIAKDFSRQVAEGKLNKPKPVKPLSAKEELFSLPRGWALARFNQVAAIQSNLVDPKRYAALPHIAPDNIESWTTRLLSYVSVGEAGVYSGKHLFSAGAILYSKIRPNLAKVAKVNFDGLCSADMYPIHALIDRDFLVKFMITKDFVAQAVKEDNRVAMPKINQSALSDIVVPVPPLAEQHHIVAKVDELMALCARLEASLTTGDETHGRLVEALLCEAIEPDGNCYTLAC